MSRPNTPNNSKDKTKADDNSKTDNSSISGDSNSSGSTTPRATPRASPTSTPGVSLTEPFPPFNSPRAPFSGGVPRPMASIDHSIALRSMGFSALPRGSTISAAPATLDGVFLRLKEKFTKLSKKEDMIGAQEKTITFRDHTVKAAQKNADEAAEKNKRESEKTQQDMHVADAKWKAAVEVGKDNEEEKKRLQSWEAELEEREADLERREAQLERRESILQRFTGGNLNAELAAIGRTNTTQQTHDPPSSEDYMSSASTLLLHRSSTIFPSTTDDPPRARTLSNPHILEHQLLSTTPSDLPYRSRANRFSPIRPRPVIPRRGSSANLSIATPTPLRARAGEDVRRMAAFGRLPGDISDSSGEEEEDVQSSAGEEEGVEMVAEVAVRPRKRSVRRVSRNENLRR